MKSSSAVVLPLMLLSHVVMVFAPAMKPVQRGQFPYLVLIKHDISVGPNYYTGTLLSLKWVLTLSEQLNVMREEDIKGLTVYAGFTKMADIKTAQSQVVTQFYKTVNENNENYPCLVLFLLAKPFVEGPTVRPVQVNNGQIGDTCWAVGWATMTSDAASGPEFVYTDTDIYETTKCSEYYNLISFESQICSLQNFEYSFFPGSALLCSEALTGIKSVDTYMKPSFSATDRIIVYIRAKAFTAWMRSHALDMSPLVYLKGSKTRKDNLLETWEERGSKRSGGFDGSHGSHTDDVVNDAGPISQSVGLTICVLLVAVYKLALQS